MDIFVVCFLSVSISNGLLRKKNDVASLFVYEIQHER